MDFEGALENALQRIGFYHWLYFLIVSSIQTFGNAHITGLAFLGKTPHFTCSSDKKKSVEPCSDGCDKFNFEKSYTSISTEVRYGLE